MPTSKRSQQEVLRGIVQNLATARQQRSNLNICLLELRVAASLASRVASAFHGRNVNRKNDALPFTTAGHVTNGLMIASHVAGIFIWTNELAARRHHQQLVTGPETMPTEDLAILLLAESISASAPAIQLYRGKTLIGKHPLSSYGKALVSMDLLHALIKAGEASRELNRRREEWEPEIRELAKHLVSRFRSDQSPTGMSGEQFATAYADLLN